MGDVPMEGHEGDRANELPKFKDVQEMLHAMRKHQEGQELPYRDLHSKISNFLTLVI